MSLTSAAQLFRGDFDVLRIIGVIAAELPPPAGNAERLGAGSSKRRKCTAEVFVRLAVEVFVGNRVDARMALDLDKHPVPNRR